MSKFTSYLNWCCIFFGWSHDHEGDNHHCEECAGIGWGSTPYERISCEQSHLRTPLVTRPSQRQPHRKLPHKMLQLCNSAHISTTCAPTDAYCCWSGTCTVRVDAPQRWHSGCSLLALAAQLWMLSRMMAPPQQCNTQTDDFFFDLVRVEFVHRIQVQEEFQSGGYDAALVDPQRKSKRYQRSLQIVILAQAQS
jgi:hypothetical protein